MKGVVKAAVWLSVLAAGALGVIPFFAQENKSIVTYTTTSTQASFNGDWGWGLDAYVVIFLAVLLFLEWYLPTHLKDKKPSREPARRKKS